MSYELNILVWYVCNYICIYIYIYIQFAISIWRFPEMRVPLDHSFYFRVFPWNKPSIWGYPPDLGNHQSFHRTPGVVHRDLKPGNVLFGSNEQGEAAAICETCHRLDGWNLRFLHTIFYMTDWWWLEPWNFWWLSIELGMSSSQLTNSMIFQRGRYTTNQMKQVVQRSLKTI